MIDIDTIPPSLVSQNRESWAHTVKCLEGITSRGTEYATPVLNVARQLASSDIADAFRAGQSLWNLMISTSPEHGLLPTDPYVAVGISDEPKDRRLYVAYQHYPNSSEIHYCSETEALLLLPNLLERLWCAPHPAPNNPSSTDPGTTPTRKPWWRFWL